MTDKRVTCQHKWTWAEPLGLPGQHVWFCERCGMRKPAPTPEERAEFKRSELDAARALFTPADTTDWDTAAGGRRMTPRQFDIIRLLALGLTEAQVGVQLGISLNTVHTHRTAVYRQCGATSLLELLRLIGWLIVPDPSPMTRPSGDAHA